VAYGGVKLRPNDAVSITGSLHAYQANPFWGRKRERAVSTFDSTISFDRKNPNLRHSVNQSFHWVLCHNTGSQQTHSVIYLFHPDDFSEITVSGGGFSAKPAKINARFAVKGLKHQYWGKTLETMKSEARGVLERLSAVQWSDLFAPVKADIAMANRLRELAIDLTAYGVRISKRDEQIINGFSKWTKPGTIVPDASLGKYLKLRNQARELEKKLAKAYIKAITPKACAEK
jgi:hypothetical protein